MQEQKIASTKPSSQESAVYQQEELAPHVLEQSIPERLELSEKLPEWNKFIELIETMGMAGLNQKDRLEWFKDHSSANEIIAFAALTHSFLAPNAQQAPVDFTMSMKSGKELMVPDERYQAFVNAAEAIEDILGHPAETDEQIAAALARSANVIAYTLLVAHPFEDGNGRTARVLSHVLREGVDPEDGQDIEDIKTLGVNRKLKNGHIGYTYIPQKTEGKTFQQNLSVVAGENIPLERKKEYEHSIASVMFVPPFYD